MILVPQFVHISYVTVQSEVCTLCIDLTGHWRGGGEMGGGGGRGGRGGWGGGRGGSREMDRPWVTPGLRQEILKTKVSLILVVLHHEENFSQSLASVARKEKSAEAVAALGEQQERMEALLEEAKVNELDININILMGKHCIFQWGKQLKTNRLQVHWLARHPEHEQAWLNVLAEEERYNCRFP